MRNDIQILFASVALMLSVTATRAQTITFIVDMTNYLAAGGTIGGNGVHVTGNFTIPNWDPTTAKYELIQVGASDVYSLTLNDADLLDPGSDYQFKFTNSHMINYGFGVCHIDQECLPNPGSCSNGNDNRSFAMLPGFDAEYYASWDSCSDAYLAPVGIQELNGSISSINIYPNPARDVSLLSYVLINSEDVQIYITNTIGRVLQNISQKNMAIGQHQVSINTSGLEQGIYFVNMKTGSAIASKQLAVVR